LAFTIPSWSLLIGSRPGPASTSETHRFARSAPHGSRPKPCPAVGLLSWGSSSAPSPTRPSLRPLPPGPSSRLRPGTATSRTRSVLAVPPGYDGFLRSGPIRRPSRSTACGFVAPRSRPWGSLRFQLPVGLSAFRDPKVISKLSPSASTLRSFPLSSSLTTASPPSFSSSRRAKSVRSPGGVPSRRSARRASSCCHDARSRPSTSGLFSAEESVAHPQSCPRGWLDAPMGFGSTVPMPAARDPYERGRRRSGRAARSRPAVQRRAGVHCCRGQRGRQEFSACLASRTRCGCGDPKIGHPPSVPLAARRLLRSRSAPLTPGGVAGIGSLQLPTPKGWPSPAPRPEGLGAAMEGSEDPFTVPARFTRR